MIRPLFGKRRWLGSINCEGTTLPRSGTGERKFGSLNSYTATSDGASNPGNLIRVRLDTLCRVARLQEPARQALCDIEGG